MGVSKDAQEATTKALRIALLNAVVVPRYRERTVFFPHHHKYVKTEMSIFPRPLEFGIVAPPVIIEACELLGLHDITVKAWGRRAGWLGHQPGVWVCALQWRVFPAASPPTLESDPSPPTLQTHKSRNTRNVVKCFFQALCAIPTPQEIAEAEGCYVREKVGRKMRVPRTEA